MVAPTVILST